MAILSKSNAYRSTTVAAQGGISASFGCDGNDEWLQHLQQTREGWIICEIAETSNLQKTVEASIREFIVVISILSL